MTTDFMTTDFIEDRAQTLVYEALQYPAVSKTACAWLRLAVKRLDESGKSDQAQEIDYVVMNLCGERPDHH